MYVSLNKFNSDPLIVYDFKTQESGVKQADEGQISMIKR